MSNDFLPPVVAILSSDIAAYTAGLLEAQARMDAFLTAQKASMAELDASMAGMGAAGAEGGMAAGIAEVGAAEQTMAAETTAAMAEVDASLTSMSAGFADVGAAAATAVPEVTALSTEMVSLDAVTKATSEEIRASFTAINASLAETTAGMKGLTAEDTALVAKMQEDNAALVATMGEAKLGQAALGDAMQGTTAKAAEANTTLGMSNKALMGVGAAAIGAAYESAKMASDFQTQMTRLYTAAGAPKQAVLDSTQAILQMGTQVGFTGTQMAEALYHPISAGLDLGTALNVVRDSAKEAQISGASLDDTTYSLSSVMKAFNLSANDSETTMASLNAIVGQGDMHFQDFNESVKNWAPTAAQMGISINSMGAGLAYLTDRGNTAEVASTRLTMGISMMTTPSQQAGKMLEGLGVASSDVSASSTAMEEAMKKANITQNKLAADLKQPDGLYVALTDLKTSLEKAGVSGTEADSVLAKIFGGGRSDKAIMSLMQNLDGLHQKFDAITTDSTTQKFEQNWQDVTQTFSFQMKQAEASLKNLGIAIGTVLLPAFTKVAAAVGAASGWLGQHQAVAASLAVVIGVVLVGALAALAVKGTMYLANLAAGFVLDMAKGTVWAATKIGQFLGVTAAAEAESVAETAAAERGNAAKLAGAIASGVKWLAVKTAQGIAAVASAVYYSAASYMPWVLASAKQLVSATVDGAKWLAVKAAQGVAAVASATASAAATAAAWVLAGVTMVADAVAKGAVFLATWIATGVAAAASSVAEAAIAAGAWIAANIAMIAATGGIILAVAAVIAIGIYLYNHWGDVKRIAGEVWNFIDGLFHQVKDSIVNTVTQLATSVGAKIDDVLNFFRALPGNITSAVGDLGTILWNAGVACMQGLYNGFLSVWNGVKDWLSSVGTWIANLKGPIDKDRQLLVPHGKAIMDGLHEGLKTRGDDVLAYVGQYATQLQAAVTTSGRVGGIGVGLSGGNAQNLAVGAAGGGGGQGVTINLNVAGHVWTTQDLVTEIQQQLLRHGIRNNTPGISYAYA